MVVVILVFGFLIIREKNINSLEYVLKKEGIKLNGIEGFNIEGNSLKNRDFDERYIFAKNDDGEIIRIRILYDIEKDESEQYVNDQKIALLSLYEPVPPPYPEFIGKEISCGEKYKPTLKNSDFGDYYLLYASERLGYGVCDDSMGGYNSLLGYFSFNNKLLKIEIFIDKNKKTDLIENIISSMEYK